MWMVRAESDGSLFQPFIEKGLVAIGWSGMGDLAQFKSKEALVTELRNQYPGRSEGWYAIAGGMLHRFSKELQAEDGVISYDRTRRVYAVGKLQGEYAFDPEFDPDHPNIRRVEWNAMEVSRDTLATATKNSLGSTLTLFQLPELAEEDIRGAASGEQADPSEDNEEADEEEKLLLEDLKSSSIEFIKDRIIGLDWEDMQFLVAGILRAMGYKTRISAPGPDRGVDIVASRDGFGFENPRIVVEVKHRNAQIGASGIRSFVGGRHVDDKCLYVSTGGFSKEARYEADRANVLVTLLDLHEVAETLAENYESLDGEVQRLVPLRRIYWPEG
ncbi:MAG: restriction endonuclease [Gammaproteobacteria bacterium]|nr:restriction endonuclease [Gammaproteobacteria bacterium]MDE0415056.1 restriction endonuclease [Gammaproteobacteria bacterium]